MKATIYRMKLPDHECIFGTRAKARLEASGIDVEDRLLTTRRQVDEFKNQHGVETTPMIFIDGQRIGGLRELEGFLLTAELT